MFKGKTLLITGGTGSFGMTMARRFLDTDVGEIRIFSRDEKKQYDMRNIFPDTRLKFYIGDIRDKASISPSMVGVDFVFHAAALKQVPSCEFFPMEAVKTNIIGTDNVLTACIENHVSKVVCLSTDKAVYPVNAMGISKAMMEKIFVARARTMPQNGTQICGTRYGNVLCSRGSVVPRFIELIKAGKSLAVTEPDMTRFIMSLDDAAELVLLAFKNGNNGDIFVHKAPACTIGTLAKAVQELFCDSKPMEIIGVRQGEKLYETLLTPEELFAAEDLGNFYRVPADSHSFVHDRYFSEGDIIRTETDSFTSNNTKILDVEAVKNKLLSIPYIKNELKKTME